MVEWKLQQKYIDANEPVPAHVQMDNERKWAVYQRYCHVYKDLELEMLVRQVPGLVVAKIASSQGMSSFDDIFGESTDLMGVPSTTSVSASSASISLESLGLDDLNLGDTKQPTQLPPTASTSGDPSDFLDWLDQKSPTKASDVPIVVPTAKAPAISDADMFSLDDTPSQASTTTEAAPQPPGNPFAAPILSSTTPSTASSSPAPVTPVPATVLQTDICAFSASPPMPVQSSKQPTPQHSTNKSVEAGGPSQTNNSPPHSNTSGPLSMGLPHSNSNNSPVAPIQLSTTQSTALPHSHPRIEAVQIEGGSRHSSFDSFTSQTPVASGAETSSPSLNTTKANDQLRATYRQAGKIPAAERLHSWTVLLEAKPLDPVSTPATALTELTDEMKKDALASCSVLFGDAAFCNLLKQEGVPLDNARLLMTESVEQLLRVLVTHHKMIMSNPTPLKLGSLFLPVLALTSADPLRPDVFGVMDAVLTRLVPPLHVTTAAIAMARRPLVKLLVLYHDPTIALHLDHTLPQWSDSESGILPDSWLASLFESSDHKSTIPLAALSNIWDCLIVNASATYPSIIGVFVVLYAILQSKKRLLSLTNATSLQSVMMQLLVETLSQSPSQLMQQVQTLINTTPFSFTTKLCDAGMDTSQHTGEKSISRTNSTSNVVASPRTGSKDQLESSAATQSSGNASMSKFGASLSSMNSKFFAGASKLTASIMKNESDKSSASSSVATNSTGNNRSDSFHLESTAVYFSMTISACEVIPSVFRGFKSTCTEKIRFFIVDCRPEEYLARGRIPTSFAFNSESVTDPAAFDAVMATLQPIKSSVHICIMGHGYARHANHLIKDLNIPKSLVADMLAKDAAQINDAVLFLAKRGFPYVSVVEGGYASTHRFLSKSRLFSLSDLTDHDQKACDLCQQDAALKTRGRASSVSHHSDEEDEYIQRTEGGVCLGRFGPDGRKKVVTAGTKTGRTSISSPSTASTYFNNMTNVLKDSTKTMAAVSSKTLKAVPGSDKMTDALKDSRNWMLKKTESIHLNDVSTSMTSGMRSVVDVAANPATMLKKAANSFANSLGNAEPPMIPPTSSPGHSSHTSSVPAAAQSSCASSGSSTVKKPSSKAKEAVFSIDDDDDEEDEADSFMGDANIHDTDHTSAMTPPPSSVVVHTVSKHEVHALKKGMQIRMVDLLPLVSSPLFSCYKKKARGTETLMLPRHVVIAEDHVLVLKADKVQDDVSYVRSCHHLSHIARMTCMKKNALMVTFYLSFDGKQKQKAYEVQQRDALIKVIRTSMESLAAQKESDEDSAA
ncbi:hypothetical protein H310_06418 [Aphanomyces invadans]|uniref:Rhodanese domain-containing protein n=1 Tax=Aphanomyces invadans TaxID=157072 RepID=A0A024U8D5_9STRA|nr:hypothetical protein H310_06418 [Aphanomyces invadans]ETW01848.1 hypothetical protein H310_06418 [Aphanomyces invadans]|eukprot:XP_008869696.1 hypothetical protein H310_06418 [Aphanomyces invadans]